MSVDPKTVISLLPEKVLEKIYDDAISPGAQEVGKMGVDVAKVVRLFLTPVQFLAAFNDRLQPMFDRIGRRVPEERRVDAAPQIVGPSIEAMRYLDDRSELWQMFEEILTQAVDKERVKDIHPSYPHIIRQLSRDEAWLIYHLREHEVTLVYTLEENEGRFSDRTVEDTSLPDGLLLQPNAMSLYFAHLEALNLIIHPVDGNFIDWEKPGGRKGIRQTGRILLSNFGALFAQACIPEGGFTDAR